MRSKNLCVILKKETKRQIEGSDTKEREGYRRKRYKEKIKKYNDIKQKGNGEGQR